MPLSPYSKRIAVHNRIERLSDLTREEFSSHWFNKPFILTDPVKRWPIYQTWDANSLLAKHGDTYFRAEAVDWPLRIYVEYMNNNEDESPLYLFDRSFADKMSLRVSDDEDAQADYWAPRCFGEDLLEVLQDDRPDSKWLIIGPERSGSTFHKDPNATRRVNHWKLAFGLD